MVKISFKFQFWKLKHNFRVRYPFCIGKKIVCKLTFSLSFQITSEFMNIIEYLYVQEMWRIKSIQINITRRMFSLLLLYILLVERIVPKKCISMIENMWISIWKACCSHICMRCHPLSPIHVIYTKAKSNAFISHLTY